MYDNDESNSLVVTKLDGELFKFKQSETGLHYLDTDADEQEQLMDGNPFVVNTVSQN